MKLTAFSPLGGSPFEKGADPPAPLVKTTVSSLLKESAPMSKDAATAHQYTDKGVQMDKECPVRRSENDLFDLFNLPHPGKYVVRFG